MHSQFKGKVESYHLHSNLSFKFIQIKQNLSQIIEQNNLKDMSVKDFIRNPQAIKATTKAIVALYILSLFSVISLFYLNKYYNMGIAKYYYFKCMSYAMFVIIGILCILYYRIQLKGKSIRQVLSTLSVTDSLILAYAVISIISFLFTPYKNVAFTGTLEWNMGLVSQLIFVGIYYVTSRFFKPKKGFIYFFLFVSIIVFILGIIMRFGIDPLNMYDQPLVDRSFLSTIGQPTWYSSYLCSVYPLGLFLYWNSNQRKEQLLTGIYCFLSFATLVTQNSDSAYISFVLVFLALFLFSFKQKQHLFRWLQLFILALASFQFMGLLQRIFPDYAFQNDKLSVIAARHPAVLILLVCMLLLYAVLSLLDRNGHFHIERLKHMPHIVLGIFIAGILGTIILICCVTTGTIPDAFISLRSNNYLMFNDNWGNSRGINWSYAMRLFGHSSPLHKLIGFGPDCYGMALYESYTSQMNQFWGASVEVNNAHNEWLNCLLTSGLLGLITYAGAFLTQIWQGIKKAQISVCAVGVVLCVISYIGNNIFCYQQVVCTPIVFIVLGIGEYLLSHTKVS